MSIETVSFLEVKPPGLHIFSKFPIPRLGAVLLATLLRNEGYTVKVFVEDIAEPDWAFIHRSDLVCISTITSTAPRAYRIADSIRERGIPVVMGGPHPSFMQEEALRHADCVVRGEGDETLPELLAFFENGTPALDAIHGIAYKDASGRVVETPPRPLLADLNSLPAPDLSLIHGWKPTHIYPLSTSRGCPFSCTFCSVIQMFGRKYRFRSVEKTLEDIRGAVERSRSTLFFVDDNFAAHRPRAKAILKGMIAGGLRHDWSAQVRTDVAKDHELLRLMADSGCHTLYIGFESVNPRTLALYDKRQTLDEIVSCIKAVRSHGIAIHGMFVLGADTDTAETIGHTVQFAVDLGIDTVQFMPLTPVPGTPVFEEMARTGRLLHTDWSKYDMHHVVFLPAQMRPETLQIESLRAMERFYSWGYILRRLARLDLHYTILGLYGNRAVKRAMEAARSYIEHLRTVPPPLTACSE